MNNNNININIIKIITIKNSSQTIQILFQKGNITLYLKIINKKQVHQILIYKVYKIINIKKINWKTPTLINNFKGNIKNYQNLEKIL